MSAVLSPALLLEGVVLTLAKLLLHASSNGTASGELLANGTLGVERTSNLLGRTSNGSLSCVMLDQYSKVGRRRIQTY